MKKLIIFSLSILLVIFSVNSCTIEDDDNPATCEQMFQSLQELKSAIEDFAASSICSDEFECRYIAFGAKPCGGPREYLFYTTSIDTVELETLVADFNEREDNYNQACGVGSDCSVPTPPTGFTCEDNQCIPVY